MRFISNALNDQFNLDCQKIKIFILKYMLQSSSIFVDS